jgi:carboxyl-terminal processing protease
MTTPPDDPAPPPPQPERDGGQVALTAVVLLALGAGAVFWAGMTLGGSTTGRDAQEQEAIEAFTQAYRSIADDFIGSTVPEQVLEGALEGMVETLDDPYSDYMTADEFEARLDDAYGQFEGIGAEMDTIDAEREPCETIDQGCRLEVMRVLNEAPAEAAGLLAGDVVVGVDGAPLDGSTIGDTIERIRGPRGTEVTLDVERMGEPLEIAITRDTVELDDVFGATLADGAIGYIAVDNFSGSAAADFEDELEAHLDAGIDKLIVDVRDDPGGLVDATVDISSQFIEDGAVFWEEYADGSLVSVEVSGEGIATDPGLDVVLLVNGGSASASEILGGALQDAGRARLVGEVTFGKGSVQEWNELPGDTGGLRLSVARWLTRDQNSIDGVGLTPDVAVPFAGTRFRADDPAADPAADLQLQSAVALLLDEPLPSPPPSPSPEAEVAPQPSP